MRYIPFSKFWTTTFSSRDNLDSGASGAYMWLGIDRSQTDKSIQTSTKGQREGH